MRIILVLLLISAGALSSGCAGLLGEKDRARIAVAVMERAYDEGGAAAVGRGVDGMVLAGKLTPEQGELVKGAMQGVYDTMLDDLRARYASVETPND